MEPKQKILIVDDSEINRAMLKEILGEGYEYLEAENGLRAIEILRRRTDIALVLLDLIMPEMDGFDVLRVMQCYAWQEEIPVIVISAAEDNRSVERAYDMGVADYIRRPFERVMVLRRVKNALMLYAKQKRLTRLVTDQVYEKEHNGVLMISILSHVVEFRNSESGQHVLHIRTLTGLLLHQLAQKTDRYQLDESDISLISTASALHDIGKIMIPEEILNKPGHHQDPHHRGCQDSEGACHRAGRTAGKGGTRYLPLAPRAVGRRRLPRQAQGRRDPHCSTGGGTGRCVRRTDQRALL